MSVETEQQQAPAPETPQDAPVAPDDIVDPPQTVPAVSDSAPETPDSAENGPDSADNPPDAPPEQSADSPISAPQIISETPADTCSAPGVQEPTDGVERLLAMRVPVIVRLAQKRMRMAEILKLHLGSVIPFEQDAYRHIDLMVNNTTIGIGQTVKVGENFGLKITQMGPVMDRIRSLGGQKPAPDTAPAQEPTP